MFQPNTPFDVPGDVMRYYREKAPDADYVALQGYSVQDLVPLMGHLAELHKMRHLNLSSNELSRLPEDMSKLRALETLNLNYNQFETAAAVVKGLFSLPKLQHLHITLPEEEEEYLITTLSHLKTLNGVVLDEDQVPVGMPTTPNEMLSNIRQDQQLSQPKPPRGYQAVEGIPTMDLEVTPWTSEDTERCSQLQSAVSRVSGQVSHPEQYQDFQRLVTTHLRARTKNEPDMLKRCVHDFNAASLLIEYSFDELVRSSAKYGAELSLALQEMFKSHVALMQRASHTMSALQLDRDAKVSAIQEDLAKELLQKERSRVRSGVDHPDSTYTDEAMLAMGDDYGDTTGDGAEVIPGSPNDIFGLAELKSLITVLFESKQRHDKANTQGSLPKETMEQHLYTFYFTRVSTDDELREKVTKVFRSVKRHARSDLSCEVFSLILKSELEEQYWYKHVALTETLFDIVHSTLLAQGEERGATLNGVLSESQVDQIVHTLYPKEENGSLLRIIAKNMSKMQEGEDGLGIGYRDFVAIVLQNAVITHRQSIKFIVKEFQTQDEEATGVVDTNQFRTILGNLYPGISSSKSQDVINAVDASKNNVVTFSDVVYYVQQMKVSGGTSSSSGGLR